MGNYPIIIPFTPFLSEVLSNYRISSVIRWSFPFQNNPKDLDPSSKMDLDLWDCLGWIKLVL